MASSSEMHVVNATKLKKINNDLLKNLSLREINLFQLLNMCKILVVYIYLRIAIFLFIFTILSQYKISVKKPVPNIFNVLFCSIFNSKISKLGRSISIDGTFDLAQ